MDEPSNHNSEQADVEEASVSTDTSSKRIHSARFARKHAFGFPKVISVVALCVVSSALTAWILLATGIIKSDAAQTITQNRQSIVLQQGDVVAEVFKKLNPSTVAITTELQASTGSSLLGSTAQEGAGSGIIISADGYIMTNKHVVPDGTTKVTVVLADGTTYNNVNVVGRDPLNDIAFLKISGVSNLQAAELGNSDAVQVGQQVIAIGNALGQFRNSVTSGIISGKGRPIQADDGSGGSSEQLENLLQTDAAINPGNSGGPLVTLDGKVVGMNTAVSASGQAIGFAIPINDAMGLINSVLKQGKIVRPYLGVRYISLDPAAAQQLNLNVSEGAYIAPSASGSAIVAGSPAEKAGLQAGDIITKVNGTALDATHTLASSLARFMPGDKLTLTIVRGGKTQTVDITLEPYPGT